MPTLSIRENFMRMINKEMPEYLSEYTLFWAFSFLPFMMGERNPDGTGKDIFGVEQVIDTSNVTPAAMPKTHDFILKDITKWRDVVKLPEEDFDDSQWAAWAKEADDNRDPNLPQGGGCSLGNFQPLMGLMGFSEGLSACVEEPEEVKALMDYITSWSIKHTKKYIHYFKPDFGFLADDIAHERAPFLSVEMFRELIAPYWRAYYDVFREADLPVGHHNCGYFIPYLEDLLSMGVCFWDPVQGSNDEPALKKQYGRDLILCCFPENRFWDETTSEEQVRAEFKAFWDIMAPGGAVAANNYYMTTGIPGQSDAQVLQGQWMADEFEKIRYDYYK
ncbi:MAG: hypothetical protein LBU61_06240 [Coriobacteriales bacterium]|nr:hypothetical protein [Coriobacteriales bacterium]